MALMTLRSWKSFVLLAVLSSLGAHAQGVSMEKVLLGVTVCWISYLYLTRDYLPESREKKGQDVTQSYAIDDLQSEKRFIPKQYKRLKKRVNQSFSKMKQTLGIKPKNWGRGDGLHSIYSGSLFHIYHPDNSPHSLDMNEVRSRVLDSNQSIAFNALFQWGIFEGAELSILNELCSNATLLKRNKGQYLFEHDSENANDFLYVLKSGTCDVIFPNLPLCEERGAKRNGDDDTIESVPTDNNGDVVISISEGRVVASVVDVLAWLIRSSSPREISIRCVTDCEVVAIPSPRSPSGKFQSRLHVTSFARIVRMLLVRFNRTTNTTALFYLGLAEHMIPRVPAISVPSRLIEICAIASSSGKLALSSLDAELYPECLDLIRSTIGSLLGIDASEVKLPRESAVELGQNIEAVSDRQDDSGGEGGSEITSIPPPIAFSRTKSFDSIMDNDDISTGGPTSYYATPSPNTSPSVPLRSRTTSVGRQARTGLRFLAKGQSLLDIESTPGLYIIISGRVEVTFCGYAPYGSRASPRTNDDANDAPSFLSRRRFGKPTVFSEGDCLGQISLLAGNSTEWYGQQKQGSVRRPVMTVNASANTWLLKVSMFTYEKAFADHPEVIFHVSNRIIHVLPPMIRLFDFCTKYLNLKGGDDVIRRGEDSKGKLYVVLFGSMLCLMNEELPNDSISDSQDKRQVKDDEASRGYTQIGGGDREGCIFGRGTLIGDTQLLTGAPHKHTVRAIRQSALSEVPAALLEYLAHHYPSILTHIARNVSRKQQIEHEFSNNGSSVGITSKSIMLTPVTGSVPMNLVCSTLKTCLGHCAEKVQLVTSADAAAAFGGVLDGLSEYELILTVGSWMHQIEMDNDIVLYQADWQTSAWNRLCIINCDEILLVANTLDSFEMESTEEWLHSQTKLIPKTLLMLYTNPSQDMKPAGTRNWIEARNGAVDRHVHVRLYSNNQIHDTINYRSDFNRLARILTNTAVGVVLGGGGARGLSHLGVLQALEERNIPVDMIGGTSIGSFVGGLYAFENNIAAVNPIAESWALKMSSYWFYLQDLTLPITSYFNGHNFTSSIRQVFDRRKIEDMWLNYFCVTTDLTSHTERIHVNGTASRYIRASMSLANFLPPLCDTDPRDEKCHYLVDGGYVNTVPIDVMRNRFGAKIIIAVDVSGDWNMNATQSYGDSLSGLSVWASRFNPFSEMKNVPTMADIADQLAFVAACRQVERVKGMADLYIVPPVNDYSTLQFGDFDTIRDIGLRYGGSEIDKWLNSFNPGEGYKYAWHQKSIGKEPENLRSRSSISLFKEGDLRETNQDSSIVGDLASKQ